MEKPDKLFKEITGDARWDINDETLFIVFGLTFYGYTFGHERLILFKDPKEINSYVEKKLIELGAGEKYVKGLVEYAYSTFQQPTEGLYSQLVGIGHSHFSASDLTELKESVFSNARKIKDSEVKG